MAKKKTAKKKTAKKKTAKKKTAKKKTAKKKTAKKKTAKKKTAKKKTAKKKTAKKKTAGGRGTLKPVPMVEMDLNGVWSTAIGLTGELTFAASSRALAKGFWVDLSETGTTLDSCVVPDSRASAEDVAFVNERDVLVADVEKGLYLWRLPEEPGGHPSLLWTSSGEEEFGAVTVSPDLTLALSTSGGAAQLWHLEGESLATAARLRPGGGKPGLAAGWAVLPAAPTSPGTPGALWRVDASSGSVERVADMPGAFGAAAVSPCGRCALTGGADETLLVWRLSADGAELVNEIRAHEARFASEPTTVNVRGEELEVPHTLTSLKISPAGDYALTATGDQVLLWELDPAAPSARAVAELEGGVNCGAFSPDGNWAFTGAGVEAPAYLWRLFTIPGGPPLTPPPTAYGRGRLLNTFDDAGGDSPW